MATDLASMENMRRSEVAGSSKAKQRVMPWWVDPFNVCVFFIIPVYCVVCAIPVLFGERAVVVRFRDYLDGPYFLLGLLYLVVFANAALIGRVLRSKAHDDPRPGLSFSPWFLEAVALLAIVAYLVWFYPIFLHPFGFAKQLLGLPGSAGFSRASFSPIIAVTSLVQLGVPYVVLFLVQKWNGGRQLSVRFTIYFFALLGLSLLRVFGWAERLALLELLVPIGLLFLAFQWQTRSRVLLAAISAAPYLGIAILVVYFGATEFSRSWTTHYQFTGQSYGQFILARMATYYYTALNNGIGMLKLLEWPSWTFDYTLRWLHKFPGLIGAIFSYVVGRSAAGDFLDRYADPEFNNPSGIFPIFFDLGLAGGFVYGAVMGGFMGWLYGAFRRRQGVGVVLYPVVFIGIIEILRTPYFGDSRAFVPIVATVVGYVFFRDRRKPSIILKQ